METKFTLPTETIDLPSKGLLYDESSPLAKGTVEMKYMTAKEEDILTNQNYIQNGTVIDKLLQSMIATPNVDYSTLLSGDKNAIMIAARILAYGQEYPVTVKGIDTVVDLSTIEAKPLDESLYVGRKNEFFFTLPKSKLQVSFKLLTHADESAIAREVKGLQKIHKDNFASSTTRLKYILKSVDGATDTKDIRNFVDNFLLAQDARALREEYQRVSPDVDLVVYPEGIEEGVDLPITTNFFWPDARI